MRYPTDVYVSSFDSKKIVLVDQSGSSKPNSRRFTTINDGVANASSGDTVLVMPGLYNERIQAKDKVNIHFMNGAIVHYTGTERGPLVYDSYFSIKDYVYVRSGNISPIEWSITGDGVFIQDTDTSVYNGLEADMATVCVFSLNKNVHISGRRFINLCETFPNNSSLLFYDGFLTFHASECMETPYDGVLGSGSIGDHVPSSTSKCYVTTPFVNGVDNGIEWSHPGTLYADIQLLKSGSDLFNGTVYLKCFENYGLNSEGASTYVILPGEV